MQSMNSLEHAPWRCITSWLDDWEQGPPKSGSVVARNHFSAPNLSTVVASRILFRGQTLILRHVASDLNVEDVRQCIMRMGVSSRSVQSVSMSLDHGEASIQFKHPHVAKAVAAMLQNYPTLLWGSKIGFDHSNAAPQRCTIQDIDLTEKKVNVVDYPGRSTRSLYQGYDLDVYEDNMSTESDSDGADTPNIGQSSSNPRDSSTFTEHSTRDFSSLLSTHMAKTFEPSSSLPDSIPNVFTPEKAHVRTMKPIRLSRASVRTLSSAQSVSALRRKTIKLPHTPYNKARRILLPSDPELPLLAVSMRADIHYFDRQQRYRVSGFSSGNSSDSRRVVDACMMNDVACIGYNKGPCQLSLVRMNEEKGGPFTLVDLDHRPHRQTARSGADMDQGSISCLAAKGTRKDVIEFFTGGYDKVVRLWSVINPYAANSEEITRTLTIPDALVFTNNRLLIATSSKVLTVDLGHLTARPTTAQFSNLVHQIHLSRQAPNVTVMEVKHLEYQFEIFDDRISHGFNRVPDCHFGYRGSRGFPSRFSRGDISEYAFVKGYDDGTLCKWDFRNPKLPLLVTKEVNFDPIVHTVFDGSHIITYGKSSLTFLSDN